MNPRSALAALLSLSLGCATTQTTSKEGPTPTPEAAPPPKAAPAAPTASPPPPLEAPPPLHTIVLPDSGKPIVSLRLAFRAGSIDDPPGKEGLTSLTSSLMAEGGTRELTSAQLLEALFPMAAELSVTVDKELTVFQGRVHRDKLDRFLQIFGDVLLEPRFDPQELERLRADHVNAIKNALRGQDDETLGKVALEALLYPNHPYRHHRGGTVQGLSAITLEDVKAHWRRVFTQDRLVVGLAGPVDAGLKDRITQRLSALPATGAPRPILPPAPQQGGRVLILTKDALSTAISFGHAYALRRGHPDYYPVAFALSLLGEHRQFHGVLFQELREKRGLNYGDYAYAEHFEQEGWTSIPKVNLARSQQDFSIWIRPVEPQNAIFATRGALFFLDELLARPAEEERFETARGFLLGLTRLWEQTDQRRLGYAIDEVLYGTPGFLDGYRAALEKLTPEQVHAAVRRHLSPERLNFVYVAKDGEGLAAALKSGKPSPISYPSPKPPEVLELDKRLIVHPIPVDPSAIELEDAQTFMER